MAKGGNVMGNASRLRKLAVWVAVLLAAVLLAGCDDEVVETAPGYDVKRLDAKVWASTDGSQPKKLLLLNDNLWHGLVGARMATTDSSGQAQLKGPNCTAVYVYENSGLTMSACPKGGGTGSCSTGTLVSKNCQVSIRTMPADVDTVGTWFSVTYLEELQLTLVIVFDGEVRVTPYTQLDYTLINREQLEYEVNVRERGEPVDVSGDGDGGPRFLYTASDDRLRELQELGELPPARTALSLPELLPLREQLAPLVPNLEPWIERILEDARQDGFEIERQAQSILTLVTIENGEPLPNLAQAWEVSEDGLQWTFFLSQDRELSDGRPYTTEIVEDILTLKEEGFKRIKGYAGSERIDDYTIVFLLESPNPDFLLEISQIELPQ